MNKLKLTWALAFARGVWRELPDTSPEQVHKLLTLAREHLLLCVARCNGEDAKATALRACEAKIRAVCAAVGCQVKFQGDPRGCTVKLILPSGTTDDFDGTGWRVPQ